MKEETNHTDGICQACRPLNTPQQILQDTREEYKKFKCIQGDCAGGGHTYPTEEEPEGGQCQFCAEYLFPILSWHTSTLQSFIEAEIAREEGDKWKKENGWSDIAQGYNNAKEETVAHFKELLLTLKK